MGVINRQPVYYIIAQTNWEFEYAYHNEVYSAYFNDTTNPVNYTLASFECKNAKGEPRWINYKVLDAQPSTCMLFENSIKYTNCFTGIDIEYIVEGDRLKENIHINSKGPSSLTFTIKKSDGVSVIHLEDQTLKFIDVSDPENFQELWVTPPPFAIDSSGRRCDICSYTLGSVLVDGVEYDTVTVSVDDQEFLDTAVYPIVIDPTTIASAVTSTDLSNSNNNRYCVDTAGIKYIMLTGGSTWYVYKSAAADTQCKTWTAVSGTMGQSSGVPTLAAGSMCIDSTNRVHCVWSSTYTGATTYYRLAYNTFASGGSWGTVQRYTADSFHDVAPSIAVDSSDVIHCVYYTNEATPQLLHQTVSSSGWGGSPVTIRAVAGETIATPCLNCNLAAGVNQGDLCVVWTGSPNGSAITDIWESHSTDGGAIWSSKQSIASSTLQNQTTPHLGIGTDGFYIVVWLGADDSGNQYGTPIKTSVSTDFGATWSTPVNAFAGVGSTSNVYLCNVLCITASEIYIVIQGGLDIITATTRIGFIKSTDSGATWTIPKSFYIVATLETLHVATRLINNDTALAVVSGLTAGTGVTHNYMYITGSLPAYPTFVTGIQPDAGSGLMGNAAVAFDSTGRVYVLAGHDMPVIASGYTLYRSTDNTWEAFEALSSEANMLEEFGGRHSVWTSDSTYIIDTAGGVDAPVVYKNNGDDTFKKIISKSSMDGARMSNAPSGMALSTGDTYLIATSATASEYVCFYKKQSAGNYTKLTTNAPDTQPAGLGRSCAFHPSGTYAVVGHDTTPFITFYKRTGDTFIKLTVNAPNTAPASSGTKIQWSPNGTYISVVHTTTPYITFYKNNGDDTFTKLTVNAPNTNPPATGRDVRWSPNSTYIAVGSTSSTYLTFYKNNGDDTFTKLTVNAPNTHPGSGCNNLDWSADGTYIAFSGANATGTALVIYKNNGDDTFTKLTSSAPDYQSASAGQDVAFSPDGTYLLFGHGGDFPRSTVYKRTSDTFLAIVGVSGVPPNHGQQGNQDTPNMVITSDDKVHVVTAGDTPTYTVDKICYTNFIPATRKWKWPVTEAIGGITNMTASTRIQSTPNICKDSSDNLYVCWRGQDNTHTSFYQVKFTKSTDGGATWSAWVNTGAIAGYSQTNPQIAISPFSGGVPDGYLYIVAHGLDATYTTTNTIHLWKSTDRGATWSGPTVVDGDATYSHSLPSIAVTNNFKVHLVYLGANGTYPTISQVLYTSSEDNGATWSAAVSISLNATLSASNPCLKVDSVTGYLFCTYTRRTDADLTGDDRTWYTMWTGSSWTTPVVFEPLNFSDAKNIKMAPEPYDSKMVVTAQLNSGTVYMSYIQGPVDEVGASATATALAPTYSLYALTPPVAAATAAAGVPTYDQVPEAGETSYPPVADAAAIAEVPTYSKAAGGVLAEAVATAPNPTPSIVYVNPWTGGILKYMSSEFAEAGTTTTAIKITGHGLTTFDMVANYTVGLAQFYISGNMGSQAVIATGLTANSIPVEIAIPGQAEGDTIRLYKYTSINDYIEYKSLTIRRELEGKSTASFNMFVTSTADIPIAGQYIRLDISGDRMFWGTISDVSVRRVSENSSTLRCSISCVSLNQVATRRTIRINYTEGDYCGTIVQQMRDTYLYQEGIQAGTYEPGAALTEDWGSDAISIAEVLDYCASLSGFQWYINEDAELIFEQDPAVIPIFGTSIVEGGAFTDFRNVETGTQLEGYANKIFLSGGGDEYGDTVVISSDNVTEIFANQLRVGGTGVYGRVMRDASMDDADRVVAGANTTTTTIHSLGHGQEEGWMVWNITRGVYGVVISITDSNHFVVGTAIAGQVPGDTIVLFNTANFVVKNELKRQSTQHRWITFESSTVTWIPGYKIDVLLPTLGITEQYYLIESVEISEYAKRSFVARVRLVLRDNSNFSTQKSINWLDYFGGF